MFYIYWTIIYTTVFFMGASLYSFLCSSVEMKKQGQSVLSKRAKCPHCDHEQKAMDNFPIISYIIHKGKCKYCKEKMSKKNIIFEFVGAIVAVLMVFIIGIKISTIVAFVISMIIAFILLKIIR